MSKSERPICSKCNKSMGAAGGIIGTGEKHWKCFDCGEETKDVAYEVWEDDKYVHVQQVVDKSKNKDGIAILHGGEFLIPHNQINDHPLSKWVNVGKSPVTGTTYLITD